MNCYQTGVWQLFAIWRFSTATKRHKVELVREWIAKIRPSFFANLQHISPILEKITRPFHLLQQKIVTWSKSFLRLLRPLKGGWWVKNWECGFDFFFFLLKYPVLPLGIKSLSFGKIPTHHQDLWGISANVNNILGLFTTHSLTNSNTKGKKKPRLDFSPPPEHNVKLGDQLSEAFSGGQFSDVTLVCEEKMFPCHKVILSARSDVFKAMFSHENTKEGQTNQVCTD